MKSVSLSLFIRVCLTAAVFLAIPIATSVGSASEVVRFKAGFSPGTIVIKTSERRLYYVLGDGTAVRYPVGVGRAGQTWKGSATITGKYIKPGWRPPEVIKQAQPNLPDLIPGGSPENPMGAAALTLSEGEYAIHGTNRPSSIGGFVSYGCIRMYNSDIRALYRMVGIGTPVVVER